MSESKRPTRAAEIAALKTRGPKEKPRNPSATPKQLRPIALTTGRKLSPEEFFTHALAMAQINPSGFRQPSDKAKNYKSTSLMEKLSLRMGISAPRIGPERSDRGKKKLAARIENNVLTALDRLIDKYPEKARLARVNERLVRWFAALTMEALERTPALEELETLVKTRIEEGERNKKYLHASAWKDFPPSEAKEAA